MKKPIVKDKAFFFAKRSIDLYKFSQYRTKMSISSKKARAVYYWLELLGYSDFIEFGCIGLKNEASELMKILTVIVKTNQTKNQGFKINHYQNVPSTQNTSPRQSDSRSHDDYF